MFSYHKWDDNIKTNLKVYGLNMWPAVCQIFKEPAPWS